jgi:hypothetical protein
MIAVVTTRTTETKAGLHYPTRLGALKMAAGGIFDSMAVRSTRKRVGGSVTVNSIPNITTQCGICPCSKILHAYLRMSEFS